MKFLSKNADSPIARENIQYILGNSRHNAKLRDMLVDEQHGFCAYTEKRFDRLDAIEVDHFTAAKKGNDDYWNYYAVMRKVNGRKQDYRYAGCSFHDRRFFQDARQFEERIRFVSDESGGRYVPGDSEDTEAAQLIEFLQFNHPDLTVERYKHLQRLYALLSTFDGIDDFQNYLIRHEEELDFITAIEAEFKISIELEQTGISASQP